MRCCGHPCWSVWHPGKERNVAWACRLCGGLTPMPGFEECAAWAQNEWLKHRRILSGKGGGKKPTVARYPRKQLVRSTVTGETKDCTLCRERLPLSAFGVDSRASAPGAIKYRAWCRACGALKDREYKARNREQRNARRRGLW